MLAFSVREALREAAAAFGPAGPASTWPARHPGGGVLGGRGGAAAGCRAPGKPRSGPRRLNVAFRTPVSGADMHWLAAVRLRRERQPGVLVTVTAVRGHAPREAGAKMVVGPRPPPGARSAAGNLEDERGATGPASCSPSAQPRPETDDREPHRARRRAQHGVQCCGGEVTAAARAAAQSVPAVAIFGVGHVGLELARILARHDLDLHLVDSRETASDRRRAGAAGHRGRAARCTRHHGRCPGAGARRAARRHPRAGA